MPPPTPSTAPARLAVGALRRGSRHFFRSKTDPFFISFFDTVLDRFGELLGCHFGSLFAPCLLPDRSWTLIFIKNVDFHGTL